MIVYFQTPGDQLTNKQTLRKGDLVDANGGKAIRLADGSYLSVLHDDPFTFHSQSAGALDQETFLPVQGCSTILVADRTNYPLGECYSVIVLVVE